MITANDIIPFTINKAEMKTIFKMAKAACVGGSSNIRGGDRMDKLLEDQLVGQIGQYAGSMWLTGTSVPYLQSRWVANQNPTVGDGGSDILGSNIDFKASLMRSSSLGPMQYRLAVRPRERHLDWVYVLILLCELTPTKPVRGYLMGWIADEHLPEQPESSGVFQGAYVVRASDLNPLPPFKWSL